MFALYCDTDLYLEQSGWERFAEAQSCTVYRKPHDSGLFMYKGNDVYININICCEKNKMQSVEERMLVSPSV